MPQDLKWTQDLKWSNGPKQPEPTHDPQSPPMKDPPDQPMHDPAGDPTYEPEQPFGDPTPVPGEDPRPQNPDVEAHRCPGIISGNWRAAALRGPPELEIFKEQAACYIAPSGRWTQNLRAPSLGPRPNGQP